MDWTKRINNPLVTKGISAVVLMIIAVGIRSIIVRKLIRNKEVDANIRRQWIVTTRNTIFLIMPALVIVIWLEQLRTVATTVVVITVSFQSQKIDERTGTQA